LSIEECSTFARLASAVLAALIAAGCVDLNRPPELRSDAGPPVDAPMPPPDSAAPDLPEPDADDERCLAVPAGEDPNNDCSSHFRRATTANVGASSDVGAGYCPSQRRIVSTAQTRSG
jgi:hypothetical protein